MLSLTKMLLQRVKSRNSGRAVETKHWGGSTPTSLRRRCAPRSAWAPAAKAEARRILAWPSASRAAWPEGETQVGVGWCGYVSHVTSWTIQWISFLFCFKPTLGNKAPKAIQAWLNSPRPPPRDPYKGKHEHNKGVNNRNKVVGCRTFSSLLISWLLLLGALFFHVSIHHNE